MTKIEVYRVGLLADLYWIYRCLRCCQFALSWRRVKRLPRRTTLLRRSYYNGYLAEDPAGSRNCGHGWTRKRALASLDRCEVRM